MKNIVALVIAAAAGFFVYVKFYRNPKLQAAQTALSDMKKGDTAPVRYVESLQKDVQKADDTAEKANAAIQQNTQNIDDALKEAGQ